MEQTKPNITNQADKKEWTTPEIRELNTQSTLAGINTWTKEGALYNPPIS